MEKIKNDFSTYITSTLIYFCMIVLNRHFYVSSTLFIIIFILSDIEIVVTTTTQIYLKRKLLRINEEKSMSKKSSLSNTHLEMDNIKNQNIVMLRASCRVFYDNETVNGFSIGNLVHFEINAVVSTNKKTVVIIVVCSFSYMTKLRLGTGQLDSRNE